MKRFSLSSWRRLSKTARWEFIILVALLAAFRLALPTIIQRFVNQKLDELPNYDGRIGKVRVHLYRGAYSVDHVEIFKTTGKVPEPFFAARSVDFSVQWSELFHGSVASEISVDRATLNFVKGETEETSQTKIDKGWVQILEDLFPFKINRFEAWDSEVWYRDHTGKVPVDIALTKLVMVATNLTNSRDLVEELPSSFRLEGQTIGGGRVQMRMRVNLLTEQPTFDLNAELRNSDLTAFNDFLRAYAKVDVSRGTLSVFSEVNASEGRFVGYVRPLLEDLDIIELKDDKGPLKLAWEAIVAAAVNIFKNHPKDQFGTQVPFSGSFDTPSVAVWRTVLNTLHHAFIEALPPRVEDLIKPGSTKDSDKGAEKKKGK